MKNITSKPSQGNNHTIESKPALAVDIEIYPDSIKMTRKALGLTVEHFAWLIGVSPSSIFRYESTGVPTIHHGALTRKLHLLNFWLNHPESAEIMAHLLMVKDGLPAMSGLLEMGGVLMVQEPAETRIPGGNHKGSKTASIKAGGKAQAAKSEAAKSEAAKSEAALAEAFKPETAAAQNAPPRNISPLETPPAGDLTGDLAMTPKNGLALPGLPELAKRGFRAFNLAAGVLDKDGQGLPLLSSNSEPPSKPARMEIEAKELEAEAMLIEAQARKLEAEARKYEAEQRMVKAKKGLES